MSLRNRWMSPATLVAPAIIEGPLPNIYVLVFLCMFSLHLFLALLSCLNHCVERRGQSIYVFDALKKYTASSLVD